jgi:hypothetical protein
MNPPVDLEHVVTSWLRDQASASGSDRVLAAALGRAATVPQERRRPTWLHLPTSSTQLAAMVVATTVVIAVASIGLLSASRDVGPRSVGSTPAPSPSQSSTPTPTEAGYPTGYDIRPGDRQSLTVDGVRLSFSVPTEGWMPGIQLKNPDGTMPPRSLYIGKGIVRGQAAEAVVFWTAFPEGVNTDPCAKLLDADIGPSAADLAAAMAKAPGTDVVTGPSGVTLGGHAAKHVVLSVRERVGCDPGFFFSWPDECWGACWTVTDVGDQIGIWVVDVDGTRLVIETETSHRPDPAIEPEVQRLLESALVLEVQQIVESIRFQ